MWMGLGSVRLILRVINCTVSFCLGKVMWDDDVA